VAVFLTIADLGQLLLAAAPGFGLALLGRVCTGLGTFIPSPRTYGCFPVILAEFVREEQVPGAARRHPEDDVVPGSAPRVTRPRPAAGRLQGRRRRVRRQDGQGAGDATQPKQFPIGIDYVIVNGQVVVDSGKHTGMLAGLALRRGQAST
jgi:N-acyl-D-amino-acid deacylase